MRWIAGLAIVLAGTPCQAQGTGNLGALVGVWAHTPADCAEYTSGKIDQLPDRASKTPYELIGVCGNGIDLLYQPVGCRAKTSTASGTGSVDVRSMCSVKDYELEAANFRIEVTGPDSISFNESDFTGNFSISGAYVRCRARYSCSERVNEIAE